MLLLLGHAHTTVTARRRGPNGDHLGRLIQPRHYSSAAATAAAGIPWAADNDAFNGWTPKAEARFVTMLDAIGGLPGCLFVASPDVVGDAAATADLFARWAPEIRRRRLPVALVLQDGIELAAVPWRQLDAVFIGGSTPFKGTAVVVEIVAEARRRGLWVHAGRVNGWPRVNYSKLIGAQSFDGTCWSRFWKTHVDHGLDLAAGEPQPALI